MKQLSLVPLALLLAAACTRTEVTTQPPAPPPADTAAVVASTAGHPAGYTVTALPLGHGPWGVAISASGDAYVTQPLTDSVARVDMVAGVVLGGFVSGNRTDDMVCDGAGHTAYVTNINDIAVGVLSLAGRTATAAYAVYQPIRVRVSKDGTKLYVTTSGSTLLVLYAATGTQLKTLDVGGMGNGMAMTLDGSVLWVASTGGALYEIATASDSIVRTVGMTGEPQDAVLSRDGSTLYVADETGGRVAVVDTRSGALLASVAAPRAFALALTPDGQQLWVSQSGAGMISVVDTHTREVVHTIAVDGAPRHLGFNPSGSIALVANEAGSALLIH